MVINSGNTNNLVSTKVMEKLSLKKMKHPTPYKVSWLQKGHQLLVNEQCEVELQIGNYKIKYHVISCPWMCATFCWVDLGSLTVVLHMMGRRTLISSRRMV